MPAYTPDDFILHEKFQDPSKTYNIGLIKIKEDLGDIANIFSKRHIDDGQTLTAYGFGFVDVSLNVTTNVFVTQDLKNILKIDEWL